MSKREEDILKAIDRNTKAMEELARLLKRDQVEKPRDPAQPEGPKRLKG
jgi:hypothetical protein